MFGKVDAFNMELTCRNCGRLIPEEDRNEETTIAVCPNCGTVFDFNDELRAWRASLLRAQPPPRLTIHELPDGGLTISFPWLNWRAWLFTVAGIFVVALPIGLFNFVGGGSETVPSIFYLPLVMVILFGLWLLYYSLTLYMNQTVIEVNRERVEVRHGPLPLRRNRRYMMSDLKRVMAEGIQYGDRYSTAKVYAVRAVLRASGSRVVLLQEIASEATAVFIAQQIDSYITSTPEGMHIHTE